MRTPFSSRILLAVVFAGSPVLLARQNPTLQGHPEDYVRADIEYGARVFTEQCAACHGETGDGVAGVNLRSGKFKNAVTDPQLRTVIATGFPNAGMPAFTLSPSELTGADCVPAQHEHVRPRLGHGRRYDPRSNHLRRQGCLPQLSSRQQRRQPEGPGSERCRRESKCRLARTIASRSQPADVSHQSPRAHRDARRQGDQRPPAERRYVHDSARRRRGSPDLGLQGRPAANTESRQRRRCPPTRKSCRRRSSRTSFHTCFH